MQRMSAAREDYLKLIYARSAAGEEVTNGLLVRDLGVSAPSVSAMVKRLEAERLVRRASARQVVLTGQGERVALAVIRKHRLLETFLAKTLGLPWDELHAEAELLEHAVSDRLAERIDAALGHPTRDPHGDPIPSVDGDHDESWGDSLGSAAAGSHFRIERVRDQDSAALRYLGQIGAVPGVTVEVRERLPFGAALRVCIDGAEQVLGDTLTGLIHGRAVTLSAAAIDPR